MKTARRVVEDLGWRGHASLYELSEPHEGNRYVVVSAAELPMLLGVETYIFAGNEPGSEQPAGWGELDGSMKGVLDHAAALRAAGYEIVQAEG